MSTPALEARVDLSRNRLETMLKVLDVDGAVRRVRGGWEATGQEWAYDADRYRRVAEAREREQRAMLDYLTTDRCRMWFLRDQLTTPNFPERVSGAERRAQLTATPPRAAGGASEAWTCGRCDNCGGLDLPSDVSSKAVAEAADRLSRPGVPIEPRKLLADRTRRARGRQSGRIKQPAEEGRAIARLTDLGHGTALRDLFRR